MLDIEGILNISDDMGVEIRDNIDNKHYIFNEHGEKIEFNVDMLLKREKEIPSNVFIPYQEIIVSILNLAGISNLESYGIIKDVIKNTTEDILKHKEVFIYGFAKKIQETTDKNSRDAQTIASSIWRIIINSARYSFSASHVFSLAAIKQNINKNKNIP